MMSMSESDQMMVHAPDEISRHRVNFTPDNRAPVTPMPKGRSRLSYGQVHVDVVV